MAIGICHFYANSNEPCFASDETPSAESTRIFRTSCGQVTRCDSTSLLDSLLVPNILSLGPKRAICAIFLSLSNMYCRDWKCLTDAPLHCFESQNTCNFSFCDVLAFRLHRCCLFGRFESAKKKSAVSSFWLMRHVSAGRQEIIKKYLKNGRTYYEERYGTVHVVQESTKARKWLMPPS